jgi:hypothetical protein
MPKEKNEFESRALEAYLKPEWIEKTPGYWPELRRRIASDEASASAAARRRPSLPWTARWLRVSVGAAALLLAGIGIFQVADRRRSGMSPDASSLSEPAGEAGGVSVSSQTLRGKPARAFYFQTPHASYVWIAPSGENGV